MAIFIFVLLIISFFVALMLAIFAESPAKLLPMTCLSYVVGGLAMATIYELHKIPGVAQ